MLKTNFVPAIECNVIDSNNQILSPTTEAQRIVPGTQFVQPQLCKMSLRINAHIDQKKVTQRANATGQSVALCWRHRKRHKACERIQHFTQLTDRGNALLSTNIEAG